MLDFTSALYLGLRHPSDTLAPWARLTAGRPAALGEPPAAAAVADAAARLQGCERGVVATSTLHLAWDLLGALGRERVRLFVDAATYPILRWGAERAASLGAPLHGFRAHDVDALARALARPARDARPVVVTDGYCPACGAVAPLADYLTVLRPAGGLLVVDDTQAFGVLGDAPDEARPYGRGGGGTLRHARLASPSVVTIVSLAKAFGAPLAVLAGSERLIRRFSDTSQTRLHCSPPSAAALHAAARALEVNREHGERLRAALVRRVRQLRERLAAAGTPPSIASLFPVQPTHGAAAAPVRWLHRELARRGVRTALTAHDDGPTLTWVLTAAHSADDVDRACDALRSALRAAPRAGRRSSRATRQPFDTRVPHGCHLCSHTGDGGSSGHPHPANPARRDQERRVVPLGAPPARHAPRRRGEHCARAL